MTAPADRRPAAARRRSRRAGRRPVAPFRTRSRMRGPRPLLAAAKRRASISAPKQKILDHAQRRGRPAPPMSAGRHRLSPPAGTPPQPVSCRTSATTTIERERERQEHLPAEPHQLVVAVARHDRLHHREHEEDEADFEHEPDDARHPGERREVEGRQPAAEEEDRGQRADQHDRDVFAEHEQQIGRRGIFDHEAGDELQFRLRQVEGRPVGLGEAGDEEDHEEREERQPVPVEEACSAGRAWCRGPSVCASTMSVRLSEPTQSSTAMMTKPMETS